MARSEFYLDSDFDSMTYDFDMSVKIPESYRAEFQLWCGVLHQWVEDLTSFDDEVRREAHRWISKRDEVEIVCGMVGIRPQVVLTVARKKIERL